MANAALSDDIEELHRLFSYEPDTGMLRLNVDIGTKKAGEIAGYMSTAGYWYVTFQKRSYPAHRIIWALVHGEFPTKHIDHANGIRSDNRLCNLRLASRAQNMANCGLTRRNTSGFKGVYWHKGRQIWFAKIGRGLCAGEPASHLGCFKTKEEAAAAYERAARERYGEFARLK